MNPTRTIIANLLKAETPDQFGRRWIHLLPPNVFTARDGRTFDATDLAGIVERTRKYHGRTMMMIDYDHQSMLAAVKGVGGQAPAAGWVGDFQIRADGIWGLAEFTETGEKRLAGREYRYLSPTFDNDKSGRIGRLFNVALTNTPALEQLTALSRQEEEFMETEIADLRQLLGLDEAADWSVILEAVRAMRKAAGEPDPAKFVAMSTFTAAMAEANALRQGITEIDARHHVETLCTSGQLMPSLKDWAINLATANKPALDAFVAKVGPSFSRIVEPQLGNRTLLSANRDAPETETTIATMLGLTREQFVAGKPANLNDRQ